MYQPYQPAYIQQPMQQAQAPQMQMPQQYMQPPYRPADQNFVGQQSMQQQMPQPNPVRATMVTSKEEAVAAQIPFDSTINVFTDLTHMHIYTKQFDANTGGSLFRSYVLEEVPAEPAPKIVPKADFVERREFEQRISELQASIDRSKGIQLTQPKERSS